jgi:hypothetical protein
LFAHIEKGYIFALNKTDMLNLKKIIEAKNLDKTSIAAQLFPNNSRQDMALARLLKGESEMTAEQYRKLSEITKIPLGFLISDKWLVYADCPNEVKFLRGDVVAVLNTKSWLTVVHEYRDGAYLPTYEVKAENAPLKVFLQDLTDLVISNNVTHLKSLK